MPGYDRNCEFLRSLGVDDDDIDMLSTLYKVPKDLSFYNTAVKEGTQSVVRQARYGSLHNRATLAVKTSKNPSDDHYLLREAVVMLQLDHENILSVYGWMIMNDRPLLLLPFMYNSDLKSYMLKKKGLINMKRLYAFALDIASGLYYLHEERYIHRDVAARNCLVDREHRIKLADFTLTRHMLKDEYVSKSDMGMAYRWQAYEALTKETYCFKSDVWSYAVVLWELLSEGKNPYRDCPNMSSVTEYLTLGNRLEKPLRADDDTYTQMLRCWNMNPDQRPDIEDMKDFIYNKLATLDPTYITWSIP